MIQLYNTSPIVIKIPYFCKLKKKSLWPCAHSNTTPPRALGKALTNEGTCSLSFISFTINTPCFTPSLAFTLDGGKKLKPIRDQFTPEQKINYLQQRKLRGSRNPLEYCGMSHQHWYSNPEPKRVAIPTTTFRPKDSSH